MRRSILLFLLIVSSGSVQFVNAQGYVLRVQFNLGHPDCISNSVTNSTISFAGHSATRSSSTRTVSVDFTGTDFASLNGTLSISASGVCSQTYPDKPAVGGISSSYTGDFNFTSNTCLQRLFITSSTPSISGSITYYPRMATPTFSSRGVCGTNAVTISTSTCLGQDVFAYTWEIAENSSGPWRIIPGKTTASIDISQNDLLSLGMTNIYGDKYFKVTGLPGTTSNFAPVTFFYPGPTFTVTEIQPSCFNTSSGGFHVQVTSPAPGRINNFVLNIQGVFNQSIPFQGLTEMTTGFPAGSYTITIANNDQKSLYGDCPSAPQTKNLINPPPVTVSLAAHVYNGGKNTSCEYVADGIITATASGGSGSYSEYRWTPSLGNESRPTGLAAGTYSLQVKDSRQCWSSISSITLTKPSPISVTLSSSGGTGGWDVTCHDRSDGRISTSVSGGVPLPDNTYTYLWSNGSAGSPLQNVAPGSYSVTVRDANGCAGVSSSITLKAPPAINFELQQQRTLICPGDRTEIIINPTTLTGIINGASYYWSPSNETTPLISDKQAGTYSLTLTDGQTCTATKSITIIDPPPFTVTPTITSDYNGSAIDCNGGNNGSLGTIVRNLSILPPASNIASAEYYTWYKNGDPTPYDEGPGKSTIADLSEGDYKVKIRYRGTCETESSILSLNDPEPVEVDISTPQLHNGQLLSCYGSTDAYLEAAPRGGTIGLEGYTYKWSTGSTNSVLPNVGEGTYKITVIDDNDCGAVNEIVVQNPRRVEVSIVEASDYEGFGVSCEGSTNGKIVANANGGTGVYTYSWSNDKAGPEINFVPAGHYTVTASDNNGCTHATNHTLTSPLAVEVIVDDFTPVSCFNGSDGTVTLLPSKGAGGYKFSINNGNSWEESPVFTGLNAVVTHHFLVKDVNQCIGNTSTILAQPQPLAISFTGVEPAFCEDPRGEAEAIVTGGIGDYVYKWTNSQGTTVSTDNSISGVIAGIYKLEVRDNQNRCFAQNTVPITSTDGAKTTYSAVSARCFDSSDGSALVTITDGEGPFTFEWPDGQRTPQGVNLKADIYNVLVTDVRNCTVVQTVEVPAPDPLGVRVVNTVVPTCNGSCDGEITLEASGGVGNYSYEWNGGTTSRQTQLCAKVYPVIVRDANNCILEHEVELHQPDNISAIITKKTQPTCKDGCDGVLEIQATGGNGNYNYHWADGTTANFISNICPGNHRVTIADHKGCIGESILTLENTDPIPLNIGGGATVCVGQRYELDAGAIWLSHKWTSNTGFSSNERRVVITEPGIYYLDAINMQGCLAQDTFLLENSTDLLNASFLVPEEAHVSDTIVLIDITWPLPDQIQWDLPTAMRKLIDGGQIVYGKFDDPGTYTVGMKTHLGECTDEIYKSITILEGEVTSEGGRLGYSEFLKLFTMHPNPNDGVFEVEIEFDEESPVTISVWSVPQSIMISKIHNKGRNHYSQPFDLRPLSAGLYVLRLDYARGTTYLRFIVH